MTQVTNTTYICRNRHTPMHAGMCAHECARPPALPQPSRGLLPHQEPPPKVLHLLFFPHLPPEGAVAQSHLRSSKRLHTEGGRAVMTRFPGSCADFLQRLPSSKRLPFTESSGCCGFPALTRRKGQTHKNVCQKLSISQSTSMY